ncbi:MAG: DEAD/DEAH box helicase [Bacteroidetes bacterium]|nr:DEAD/DEAH box helicase [Bacteroidota bacterium]
MTFSDLQLSTSLVSTLQKKGYLEPTPIQEQAIPHILAGKDLFGCAQTGTGKTAAFALPLLQLLQTNRVEEAKPTIKALILAPTRELALQISDSFHSYSKTLGITHFTIFGGLPQLAQTVALRAGVDILIATPGRLLDLLDQGYVNLENVRHFVLDEADRMLDLGFITDIEKLLHRLPEKKQSLFFSATVAPEIKRLADTILVNPVTIAVTPISSTTELVQQSVYYVKKENKRSLLKFVLSDNTIKNALVFTKTKSGAERVATELTRSGINAEAIHGDKTQGARIKALKGFKNNSIKVLVATDIASRGIDVDKLSHVINYEIPEQAETYVHRIGRTGRAGSSGIAMSFCTKEELPYLRSISKLINKNIDVVSNHPFV